MNMVLILKKHSMVSDLSFVIGSGCAYVSPTQV